MEDFLSNTVLGLSTAAIFALAASGLVLTYTTTGIFNFAHGAIAMLGAFCYWQLHVDWGWPIPIALATVVLVIAPTLGVGIERGIMRGLVDAPETIRIIITVSLLVAILGVAQWIWPPQEVYRVPLLFPEQRLSLFDVNVTYHDLFTFGVAIVVAIGLRLVLYRTQIGLDMRASVDSRPLAMLHGARPHRSAATAWAIGCGLAAVAGVLVGPMSGQLSHTNLTLLIINAYAAAMIGRLRSLPMTFVGAVFLGLADSYAIGYFPDGNAYLISFRFVIPVVVLFVVLLVLPNPQLRTHSAATSREDIPFTSRRNAAITAAAIIGVALVLASILNDADTLRASRIFGIALIALSLVPLTGFGGQVSLCQMSFAAIGALVMAHHGQGGDPTGAPAGRGRVRDRRGPGGAARAAPLRPLPGAGHGRVRGVPGPLGVPLQIVRARTRGRSSSGRAASSPSIRWMSPAWTRPTARPSSWCWRASSRSRTSSSSRCGAASSDNACSP